MEVMKNTNYEKEETKNHSTSRLIPEGELKCVWMTAGLVAYKLCDQEYNCDFCSFNESFLGERNFQTIGDAIKNHEDRIKTVKLRSPVNNLDEFGIEKTLAERFLKGLFDFKIEKDFLYYEGHTWVKQNNGHVKIGIDDFLCKFITKIKHIILPPESTLILQEHPCCWIAGEFGTVPVVSPLSGYIISLNQEVFENPELPIADPYGRGWLLRLKPLDFEKEAESLFSSEDAIIRFKKHSFILEQLVIRELLKQIRIHGRSILEREKTTEGLMEVIGHKRFFDIFLTTFTKLHC
ncbi:MAG: hypothetical protein A2043_10335 [Candidatus Schekmanbacteria bacterium GWA2_38_9]|uniref:Glycine cleavage system protein H n=1 Tax=Candidatus Schekmanbacteria bacterium RIFCSPLOWO2_12_FULL_38_15 TaxID=1817883 RepID=A0A1F7SEG8_9BACT|nr:MAG: hypothetical protein A2043_10335 [Candidatus Schekmanbacteria bacterium GWA2_38_9]OGL49460.1 MAG: hypothetical protein A3H37_10155 [Candidatus Schekmanbacteria bacterium RIFCSPLOWO2_02_FULL_38_14]OGL52176.1 MAG: hypothetical protein A3G31_07095 [Candidatus Schekmanbacteria bacterium RIFCSPLOWO2_12_FULL_38_15]